MNIRFLASPVLRATGLLLSAVLAIGASLTAPALAGGPSDRALAMPAATDAVNDRFIIKFRDPDADVRGQLASLGASVGTSFSYVRAMSGGAHVVRSSSAMTRASARLMSGQLMLDARVAYIEPDNRMTPTLVPNDPMYPQQWGYSDPVGGVNLPPAWDITTGSTAIVVAVIDTGILPHADLAGRTVQGYDFITDITTANDGDGRDPDPSDPGDYGCGSNSTWHGTHVSGTIGAASNNGLGVAGVNWVSKILPARVLGRCGGYTSDIVDAMRWSAGIAVAGVPVNANPARVENLSLGGAEACSSTFQSAVDDVVAHGTVVVVAAGNSNSDAANFEPASCNGVIAVAAIAQNGARASFSNFGSKVAIAAPGVNVLSTLNTGTSVPAADSYAYYSGTSMASPHVAGVASLILSQNPLLTPAQVRDRLISTARTFPTGTGNDCTTALCGAGIVNAGAALAAGVVTAPPTRVNIAASSNGSVASASSAYSNAYPPSGAIDGDHRGLKWGAGGGWNDGTKNAYPDWIRVDFPSAKNVSEIDVYTIQDNAAAPVEPTASMTFTLNGITAFTVQYWTGSAWATVPGGAVTGNNKVWNKLTFAAVTTTSIRVIVNAALNSYSRIAEIEAYSDAPAVNVARPANGGTAAASSTYSSGYAPAGVIDGDRRGLNWGAGGGWNDGTPSSFPDTLQVNFAATKSINEIDVFTVQDSYANPVEPTPTTTFSLYGITNFDVQYWNGTAWVTVPGGTVDGNNLVWRKFTFPAVSTNAIQIVVRGSPDLWSRITEVEAYSAP